MPTVPLDPRAPKGHRNRSHSPSGRRVARSSRGSTAARTWADYRLDLVGDRSDAPRIPVEQLDRLHPWGAPQSWALLVEKPRRRSWPWRLAAGAVSVGLGVATALSATFASVVATTVAGLGDIVTIAAHLTGLIGGDGGIGVVGRILTVSAILFAAIRIGWRLTAWGAEEIGHGR